MINTPLMCKIVDVVKESANAFSYYLNVEEEFNSVPGQFVMVWLPDVDEKPLTVGDFKDGKLMITFEEKGKFTKALSKLKKGDSVGIRGPYGRGFSFDSKTKGCVIGGGLGIPGIATLAEQLHDAAVILAARDKDHLLYTKRFPNALLATDDGSEGFHGFAHLVLEKLLKEGKKFDKVYCCGPEIMMKAVFDVCEKNGIEMEGSFERYMRCGLGLCAACVMDNLRVCKDGPVFNNSQIKKLKDFNSSALLKNGSPVSLKEYVEWRS